MKETKMTKFSLVSAALATLIAPTAALALTVGDTMTTDLDEIRSNFEADGYTVLEIETEDGEIEVEYEKDGQVFEVSIAADTGLILEVELEDEDDDD